MCFDYGKNKPKQAKNRNHQEQNLAENVKGLPVQTNDIIKKDISTNSNENIRTENNHILENKNQFNLNRRDNLFKNENTNKDKQVLNIRPDCDVSPETLKVNIKIVGDSMINRTSPVVLSSKCKNRFRIKPYGGAISEDLVDHIRPTLRKKLDVTAVHIATNDIANDDCLSLHINLNKIRELVIELSPSTKIVPSSVVLPHGKNNINIKVNLDIRIIWQFCKTNKLD